MEKIFKQQMKPFDLLNGDTTTWLSYVGHLQDLLLASDVVRDTTKRDILLACCGRPTFSVINQVLFTSSKPLYLASFDSVVDKVKRHLTKSPLTQACRGKVICCIQQPHENVTALLASLRDLAAGCQFSERLVRDQLSYGLCNSPFIKRFLELPGKTTALSNILNPVHRVETNLLPGRTTDGSQKENDPSASDQGPKENAPSDQASTELSMAAGSSLSLTASILSLPPEILSSIFKLLDVLGKRRVAQVCRSWREITAFREVWCDTQAQIELNHSCQFVCSFFRSHGVRHITIAPRGLYNSQIILPIVLHSLPHVTHLEIDSCDGININDTVFSQISNNFKELVSLKLPDFNEGRLTDASINSICKGLKRLKHLTLMGFPGITNAGIQELAYSDLPLQYLSLRFCRQLTDVSLQHLSIGKPFLKGLDLFYSCKLSPATDAGIDCVATMEELVHLKITMNTLLSHFQLRKIASMKSLRMLGLTYDLLDDFGMLIVAAGIAPIEKLVLRMCQKITDVSLLLVSTMPFIRQLDIRSCGSFTLEGLECLMERNGNLTSLDIYCCGGIKFGTLARIVTSLPNLRWLSLSTCQLGNVSLRVTMQKLRHLSVLMVDGRKWMGRGASCNMRHWH